MDTSSVPRRSGHWFLSQAADSGRLPVALLSGFLGSGKTTLVNALLRDPRMAGTAVAVNEFGEIPLDRDLIEHDRDHTVVMANGCLCCNLAGDMEDAVMRLFSRRQAGDLPAFERLLIEPSGLSDPAPIAQAILRNPLLARSMRLEAIVCTVDALFAATQLAQHPETRKQVALADTLVLTKTDLAAPEAVRRLRADLAGLNPAAPVLTAVQGEVDAAALFPPRFLDRNAAAPDTTGADIAGWQHGGSPHVAGWQPGRSPDAAGSQYGCSSDVAGWQHDRPPDVAGWGHGRSPHVMVGEGPPSTPSAASTPPGVDGRPAPAMTGGAVRRARPPVPAPMPAPIGPGTASRSGLVADDAGAGHAAHYASASLLADAPLDWRAFEAWLRRIRLAHADALLRVKGLLNVAGADGPVVVQGVHHVVSAPIQRDAWPSADMRSRLVLIADRATIEAARESWAEALPGLLAPT